MFLTDTTGPCTIWRYLQRRYVVMGWDAFTGGVKWIGVAAVLSPIWGTLLWHTWELSIRPWLIPVGDIKAVADDLIAKYGPRAEEIAFIEEDRAWRHSETFEQGRWHLVRRELWRRYEAGEWGGPED